MKVWLTVLSYSNRKTANLCSKATLLKADTGALSSSFGSKAASVFRMDIHSLTLSSLFGHATGNLWKLDTREGKLTYFDICYHW